MGALPQAQEIIFKVQRKMSNEKIAKKIKNKKIPTHTKLFFFSFFFSLDPSNFQSF